ncbi:MAG: hypothetical protein J6W09_06170 [Bacteroidales bacterium]|nr:hypothetical protein [Bacteroidales bacterium]
MKSKNNLTITGIIVTDVTISPERSYARFTLVHNFGGRIPSLYLRCVLPEKLLDGFLCHNPRKGTPIAIDAYVRTKADGKIEAVIKHVELPNA